MDRMKSEAERKLEYNFLPMTGFEPRTSGVVGIDCSTNWPTISALANADYVRHDFEIRIFIQPRVLCIFKNVPIPASFCLFSSFTHHNFNNTNWKKHRWSAWDLNPRRRRRYHGAMAAAQFYALSTTDCRRPRWTFPIERATERRLKLSLSFDRRLLLSIETSKNN